MSEVDIEQRRIAIIRLENTVDKIIHYLDSQFGNMEYDFEIKSILDQKNELRRKLRGSASRTKSE